MSIDLQSVIALQSAVMAMPGGVYFAAFCAQWLMYAFAGFILYFAVDRGGALRRGCYEASASALVAFSIVYLFSHWFERTRPFRAFPDLVTPLINAPLTDFSLPSGHAATSFALAGSLALVYPRFAPWVFAVAFMISIGSRDGGRALSERCAYWGFAWSLSITSRPLVRFALSR
jgi:membrane-associated phospholipid phosphatase